MKESQTVFLCKPLGIGKICPRWSNIGNCGRPFTDTEAISLLPTKKKRQAPTLGCCAIAANYALSLLSDKQPGGGGEVTLSTNEAETQVIFSGKTCEILIEQGAVSIRQ